MSGYLQPPTAPAKLGWQGQPALTIPKAGLGLVPGAGLIGRTDSANGLLYLDAANAAVAEPVHFFVPGAMAAKTVGRWRNRRAKGAGTLALMEANLLTAPTAGDVSNFWRITVTDTQGSVVQLPISAAGQAFYDLNQLGLNKVVDAGTYDPSTWAGGHSAINGALIHQVIPSQAIVVGGASAQLGIINTLFFTAVTGGKAIRCTILDSSYNVLREATVYTSGTLDKAATSGGVEALTWNFDEVLGLTAGATYFVAFDMFQSWALADPSYSQRGSIGMQLGLATNQSGNLPASSVQSIDGVAPGASVQFPSVTYLSVQVDDGTNAFWSDPTQRAANTAKVHALTVQQCLAGTSGGICGPRANTSTGQFLAEFTQLVNIASGAWGVLGGASGVAPSYGDLTVAVSSVGAPAAGAAGSDLNLRLVMLP